MPWHRCHAIIQHFFFFFFSVIWSFGHRSSPNVTKHMKRQHDYCKQGLNFLFLHKEWSMLLNPLMVTKQTLRQLEISQRCIAPSSHTQQKHLLLLPRAVARSLAQGQHWVKSQRCSFSYFQSHVKHLPNVSCCGTALVWLPHAASWFGDSPLAFLVLISGWWGKEDGFVVQHRNNSVFIFKFDTSNHQHFFTLSMFLSTPFETSQLISTPAVIQ